MRAGQAEVARPTQGGAVGGRLVGLVGVQLVGPSAWSATLAADRRDGVDHRLQGGRVTDVCAGQANREREVAGSLQPPPSPAVTPVEHGTDQWEIGESLQLLGIGLLHEGEPERARAALEESLTIFRVAGNPGMVAWTAHWGALAAHPGEETLRIETNLGNTFGVTTATWVPGLARLEQDELERAALLLRDGLLKLRAEFTDGPQHIGALEALAARLLGAFDAERERSDQLSLPAPLVAYFRRHREAVQAQPGNRTGRRPGRMDARWRRRRPSIMRWRSFPQLDDN